MPPHPLVPVAKLGFVEMRSRDVEAIVSHYTDALSFEVTDRDGATTYLTTGPDHHCVIVSDGDQHGRASVGLVVTGGLDEAESALKGAGIDVERRRDPHPGVPEALIIAEVGTGIPIHLYGSMATVDVATTLGPRPTKLGHVASFTTSVADIRTFYEEVLGFRWSDQIADFFIFMRCNPDHHAVNFVESTGASGLHHVAYEARDIVHLKDILDTMAAHGARLDWGPGRHGPGHNIFTYHRDPDGNVIEVFTEVDLMFDEENQRWEPRPWHEEFPMGPKVWQFETATANKWGPMNTAEVERTSGNFKG